MTKADLVEEVAKVTELTRKDSEVIVDTMFESVIKALKAGDKLEVRGFGSFRVRQRNSRVGRNPKTGEFKDTGDPSRALTEREKAYFQALIDDMYGQFIQVVADGRRLTVQEVRSLADGRVFSGRDARERKLIDATGDFQDAVDLTAKLAGISGKPTLIRNTRQRTTLMDVLTGDISPLMPFSGKTLNSQIRFQYLWK